MPVMRSERVSLRAALAALLPPALPSVRRGALAGAMLGGAIAVATVAVAQTRTPRPSKATAGGSVPASPVPAQHADAIDAGHLSPLTPAPGEFSDASLPPAPLDYDRLLADIASLRARVAAVSDTLFRSRLAISLETSGDRARIESLGVSLDDGIVWTSPASFRAESPALVYEHAIAPGHHAVAIDVARRVDASGAFRSEQHSRFVVDVPLDQWLACDVVISDDSNMSDFQNDKQGQYELGVRMRVKAQPHGR